MSSSATNNSAGASLRLGDQPLLATQLEQLGYCVVEGAASAAWCARLRAEAEAVDRCGSLAPSLNKLATGRAEVGSRATVGALCEKRGVREATVILDGALTPPDAFSDGAPFGSSSTLQELAICCAPDLVRSLNSSAPWLALSSVDTIKVQVNDGVGGCFPMHFDTTPQTKRRLTAILYLGEEWEEAHGGQLRLYPFPLAPVDVAPRAGTLVLFSSVSSLHRVMPAFAPRVAISIWLSGESAVPRFPSAYPSWVAADEAASLTFLRTSANVSLLTKVLYQCEWAASIEDAFGGSSSVKAALALHFEEAARLQAGMNAGLLELLSETLPLKPP